MKYSKTDLLLVRMGIELYAKSKGRDFLYVDDINLIAENSPAFLHIIFNDCNRNIWLLRKCILINEKIHVDVLLDPIRFSTWCFVEQINELDLKTKKSSDCEDC